MNHMHGFSQKSSITRFGVWSQSGLRLPRLALTSVFEFQADDEASRAIASIMQGNEVKKELKKELRMKR